MPPERRRTSCLLSYGLFQSTYIPVICEITDAKHESLPLPVNIVESWSLGSEIHQSSPGHLLREIARHATLWKVQVPAPGIEPGPKISQASALPTELQQLLCRMGQLLTYIEYSNWFSFLKDLKGVRCPAEVKVVYICDFYWNFCSFSTENFILDNSWESKGLKDSKG